MAAQKHTYASGQKEDDLVSQATVLSQHEWLFCEERLHTNFTYQ